MSFKKNGETNRKHAIEQQVVPVEKKTHHDDLVTRHSEARGWLRKVSLHVIEILSTKHSRSHARLEISS